MSITAARRAAAVVGGLAAVAPVVIAQAADTPRVLPQWSRIETTTYEQRQAACAAAELATADLFVLPFATDAKDWPPQFVARGQRVGPESEPWRVVDRLLPQKPDHDAYLAQRKALAGKGAELIAWCRSRGLDDCAELEAALRLNEIGDFHKPLYAALLKPWLELRDKQQIRFSLPLPLEGEWYVLPDKTRHHRLKAWAAYAFDISQRVGDRLYCTNGKQVEDYYAFGQPIVAQADGVVVSVTDGCPDNVPGQIPPRDDANDVCVDYGGGVLGFYAHCKKGSVAVKAGDRVVRGTRLAAVGNSGATAIPHQHFTFLDWGDLSIRGRFHGEVKRGERWVAFAGADLEEDTCIRNEPARAPK